MSQETDDILAALAHHFAQLERKWRDVRDEGIMAQSARDYQIGFLTGERDELARQIEEARGILSALENETLVSAANDLVREEQTTNEAYHKIHALYWKEAVPALAELKRLARDVCDSAARELNYSPDVLLVSTPALRALGRAVGEERT